MNGAGLPQVHFKEGGKPEKVKHKNGTDVPGSSTGPEGKIKSVETYVFCSVATEDPSAQCWIFHAGKWYRVC